MCEETLTNYCVCKDIKLAELLSLHRTFIAWLIINPNSYNYFYALFFPLGLILFRKSKRCSFQLLHPYWFHLFTRNLLLRQTFHRSRFSSFVHWINAFIIYLLLIKSNLFIQKKLNGQLLFYIIGSIYKRVFFFSLL